MECDIGGVPQDLSAPAAIRQHLESHKQSYKGDGDWSLWRVIPGKYLDSYCSLAFPLALHLLLNPPKQYFYHGW